jgi:hypothetical protein
MGKGTTPWSTGLMALTINLQSDGLTRMLAFTDPRNYEKAKSGGIRYAVKSVAPAVAKNLRQFYAIPAARVKQDVQTPRFIAANDVIEVRFSRRPPTLRAYGARPARGGTSYQIFKGQRRVSANVFFLPLGPSPGLPMRREGPKLKTQYGPSIGAIFNGRSRYGSMIREATVKRVHEQFLTGVQRELARQARGA